MGGRSTCTRRTQSENTQTEPTRRDTLGNMLRHITRTQHAHNMHTSSITHTVHTHQISLALQTRALFSSVRQKNEADRVVAQLGQDHVLYRTDFRGKPNKRGHASRDEKHTHQRQIHRDRQRDRERNQRQRQRHTWTERERDTRQTSSAAATRRIKASGMAHSSPLPSPVFSSQPHAPR